MLAACSKDGPVNPQPGPGPKPGPDVDPETQTLKFVLPDGSLKTKWVAGDKIVVHGEYAKDQVTVTLDAADISADGRSASKSV